MKTFPFETKEQREELVELCRLTDKNLDATELLGFAKLAAGTIPELIKTLDLAEAREGGKLGERLREALEAYFLARIDGRSLLQTKVSVVDLSVSYFGGAGRSRAIVHLELDPC